LGGKQFANSSVTDAVVDTGTEDEVQSVYVLPIFKKVNFTNATVNGDYLGFDSPTRINAVNGSDLLLKTTALVASDAGSGFSVKFKNAS